ncbi:MAG: hypothetical protein EXR69_01325 [Myxococcales bacterium]|nr:hypothetical protein [Myxococcales bacterium]
MRLVLASPLSFLPALPALLLAASGCTNAMKVVNSDTGAGDLDSGDTAEGLDSGDTGADSDWHEYDDASLVILSPASGDFLPWSEEATFAAEVHSADGSVMDFDDISWSSDIDGAWSINGRSVQDSALDVGTHALTATANLPNGDRLAYTIGGVLVQSPYSGIYAGTLQIDLTYDTYTFGCAGSTTITVDAYGESVTGDAACLLSVSGYDLDTAYILEYENLDGVLSGNSAIDLVYTEYDIDTTGTLDTDGNLAADFTADVLGMTLDGTLTATRITRDLSGS